MLQAEYYDKLTALKQTYESMFTSKFRHRCDLSLPPGWYDLFDSLCKSIKQEIPAEFADSWQWLQVKEKFGALRAYGDFDRQDIPDHVYENVNRLINEAESKSAKICEYCGSPAPGRYSIGGWITARCELHAVPALKFFDDLPEQAEYLKKMSVTFVDDIPFHQAGQ